MDVPVAEYPIGGNRCRRQGFSFRCDRYLFYQERGAEPRDPLAWSPASDYDRGNLGRNGCWLSEIKSMPDLKELYEAILTGDARCRKTPAESV